MTMMVVVHKTVITLRRGTVGGRDGFGMRCARSLAVRSMANKNAIIVGDPSFWGCV